MLLSEAFDDYGQSLADSPLSRKTQQNTKSQVKQFLSWLSRQLDHPARCEDFTSIQARTYLAEKGKTLAPGSLYQYDAALRHFAGWLVDPDQVYLLANPMTKVARPENVRGRRIVPSPEVVARLHETSRLIFDPYRRALSNAALTLMLDCALRPGELLNLTLADYDRAAKTLIIRQTKGWKGRTVYLAAEVVTRLNAYVAARPRDCTHNRLLAINRGQALGRDGLLKILQERLHLAGHDEQETGHITPHAMRHVAATKLLKSGATLKEIMAILGHASLAATNLYLETTPEELRAAMERAMTPAFPVPERQKRDDRRFRVDRRHLKR